MALRSATHCGRWYTDDVKTLNSQLTEWLNNAHMEHGPARAIITPHAGYRYSGPTAAHAYRQVDPSNIERIFILGPSHHVSYGDNCVLSSCDEYETPFYNLPIDKKVYGELKSTNLFGRARKDNDEDEHSLEMQLPYIAKLMESRKGQFTIIPIIVGNLSTEREKSYGKILAPYLLENSTLFVISSDFCHWGKRFRFTYFDETFGEIWRSIENLDKMGMEIVESMKPEKFTDYLNSYNNTICGNHPISILLNTVKYASADSSANAPQFKFKFVKYAQSERCTSFESSSVSYASGSLVQL